MKRWFTREDVPAGALLHSPYPMSVCPHYDEIWQEWHEWFLSTGRFPTEEQRRRVIATDYPRLGAAAWPGCDRQRLWDITTLAAAIIEADDESDANRSGHGNVDLRRFVQSGLTAGLRTGFADHADQAEPRWGPLFARVWRNFTGYVQPGLLRRLAEDAVRYLDGCGRIDDHLATHGGFADVQTYLDIRYHSIGQRIDHRFVEVSVGIDLSDVIDEPILRAIVDSEMRRTIISQDVLSLYKEFGPGGDQMENIVTVIARTRDCSLPEALSVAREMFAAEVVTFDRLAEQIAGTGLGRRPDVAAFIKGLNDFSAGYMDWTARSGRYTLQDTCPWWESDRTAELVGVIPQR